MNMEEYTQWKYAMFSLLTSRGYTVEEVGYILNWWDGIKGKYEVELVGQETFDKIYAATSTMKYNDFDNWTIRILFYAPYIIQEPYEARKSSWLGRFIKAEHTETLPSGTKVTRLELTEEGRDALQANVSHIPGLGRSEL